MKSNRMAALCLLLGISITGIGFFSKKTSEQEAVLARLRQDKEKLQKLISDNERLKGLKVDPVEMERLRGETGILLKLRNEFSTLARSKVDSNAVPPSTEASIAALLQQREEILGEEQTIREMSDRAACIKNLEHIAAAKARWAADNAAEKGMPVVMENLLPYLPEQTAPLCPAGGHYSVNRTAAPPECSMDGHAVP